MKKKIKKFSFILGLLTLLIIGGLYFGVNYLYNYAIVAGEKDFLSKKEATGSEGSAFMKWDFVEEKPISQTLQARDGLILKGTQLNHSKKNHQLAIVVHGYGSESQYMKDYAALMYNLGYDVFLPDARGHGESEGDYIGFGWHERLDLIDWTKELLKQHPQYNEVIYYGVSMGAATVMMAAGEKLPQEVKLIIEDCGYDSVKNELTYQLKDMFNLPGFPLIPLTSWYTDIKVNYNFSEANAVTQLKKNELPVLFIHGSKDNFVPTEMVYRVYEATKGPKELWLVEGAGHAQSLKVAKEMYKERVSQFIKSYE